ncbi:hypothetical protein DAMA08_012380 [Martiniozyma asiatica (nom. inval.)]|nr:hypothetical protein DAMA08_012380 [Martiniozyma asiatica]
MSAPGSGSLRAKLDEIHQIELHIGSFLDNFADLLNALHDDKATGASDNDKHQELLTNCYKEINNMSDKLKNELNLLLENKNILPPHLHKKASNINNQKINNLLKDIQGAEAEAEAGEEEEATTKTTTH